jgi:hypothetical protein
MAALPAAATAISRPKIANNPIRVTSMVVNTEP